MKEVRKPLTKGVAKTPLIMQLESLECGAASLAMVMAYYGKWVALEQVREDAAVSRDGANAKNVLAAAKKYGFVTKGFAYPRKTLMERGRFPCIIHWKKAHFVVLDGFRGKKAYLHDPAKGAYAVSLEEFDKSYTGIYLEVVPGPDFLPSGKRKSILSFARKRLVGATALIVLFCVTTIIFYLIGAADPLIQQSFVDKILSTDHPEWLVPFLSVVGGIGLLSSLITLIREFFSYRILGKLAIESSSSFMWKVLRLPISFFSQRMVGDIEDRKSTNETIAVTLVTVFAPLVLNSIILVVYLVLMIRSSWILTLVGVSALTLDVIITQVMVRRRIDVARAYARDNAMVAALSTKGIEMIETIKSSGAENGYFHTWREAKDNATANQRRLDIISNSYGFIPALLSLVIELGILFLGVYLTMIGQFTVGTIVAFQGLLTALMTPAMSVLKSGQTIQEMRTEMERIDDVMEYPDDPNVVKSVVSTSTKKKVPSIEIKNLTFGYNKLAEPLIRDFSLSIPAGSSIAIVGTSGCGKSTLAKLLSGLYLPWKGEILFDYKPIIEIDRDVFTSMVSVVDQDIVLFEDTIANNIKMWDDTIEDFEMILAANDAAIYEDIMKRGGFDYHVAEGGKNFSGGERQRIEIARALANDPSVLILDEATSALDAQTEYQIVEAIKRRGVTTIVVAHRLSTVRNADMILVLENGAVVESGNHEELMAKQGHYYRLIQNA